MFNKVSTNILFIKIIYIEWKLQRNLKDFECKSLVSLHGRLHMLQNHLVCFCLASHCSRLLRLADRAPDYDACHLSAAYHIWTRVRVSYVHIICCVLFITWCQQLFMLFFLYILLNLPFLFVFSSVFVMKPTGKYIKFTKEGNNVWPISDIWLFKPNVFVS